MSVDFVSILKFLSQCHFPQNSTGREISFFKPQNFLFEAFLQTLISIAEIWKPTLTLTLTSTETEDEVPYAPSYEQLKWRHDRLAALGIVKKQALFSVHAVAMINRRI